MTHTPEKWDVEDPEFWESTGKPIANRNFFILFGNAGKRVEAGDKVSLEIGDFKVENITVE